MKTFMLTVRFPANIEEVQLTDNKLYHQDYSYLSPIAVDNGCLVVVPTRSDDRKLRLAQVIDCAEFTSAGGVHPRFIIDVVDIQSYIGYREHRENYTRAMRLLDEAQSRQNVQAKFDLALPSLTEEERAFVSRTLGLRPSIKMDLEARTSPDEDARRVPRPSEG